jgi:hypothetical protein
MPDARASPAGRWKDAGGQGGTRPADACDGVEVIDVPARVSAQMGVDHRAAPRTDVTDEHSVALAATRMTRLRRVEGYQQPQCCGSWPTGSAPWVRTTQMVPCTVRCWS